MRKAAICKNCGAAFLQCRSTQVTCSTSCRRKYNYNMDREVPQMETKPTRPKPKPEPIRFKNETMKDCRHPDCRYRGRIGGVDSCDYCFITGYPRDCRISECTHALEDGGTRREMTQKLKQLGIF